MADERHPLLPSDHIYYLETATASAAATVRRQTKRYLTSKTGHYSILILVALDVTGIFADLILTSLACEKHIPQRDADQASEVLGIVSLVFSSLFMLELIASIWAFGLAYFRSWFHWVDGIVIVAGFAIDVLSHGVVEEIGSIVVVLRLWRVIKIIEELSAGAEEQMEPLSERIDDLEKENDELRREIDELKVQQAHVV